MADRKGEEKCGSFELGFGRRYAGRNMMVGDFGEGVLNVLFTNRTWIFPEAGRGRVGARLAGMRRFCSAYRISQRLPRD